MTDTVCTAWGSVAKQNHYTEEKTGLWGKVRLTHRGGMQALCTERVSEASIHLSTFGLDGGRQVLWEETW